MKELIILVGPPGSGKSTLAKEMVKANTHVRINQDDQGKEHKLAFECCLLSGCSVVLDRTNFNKEQRKRYLEPAKAAGYKTKIIVLHESYDTCLDRALKRIENEGHPTVKDEAGARAALHTFFSKYERPEESEADEIEFRYPEGFKPQVVICDLDGTLCNTEHRQHFMNGPNGKKDWRGFFAGMDKDPINEWCKSLLVSMNDRGYNLVYCSGRGNEYRARTKKWLSDRKMDFHQHLFMRCEKDSRVDWQIKENILDFEILTRYTPLFAIDDRQQVVDMWRRRGIVCLQCDVGDF